MKIAFIGAGSVNFGGLEGPWDHASRLEKIPGVEVVAIVDPVTTKASEVLKKRRASKYSHVYEKCLLYSDVKYLLSNGIKVDAAFVGTPPNTSGSFEDGKDIELKLVQAGVHVFCEKPLSILEPEKFTKYSKLVREAAKEKNIIVSVGYMFRHHAAIKRMKELIQNHGGKVMCFEARYYHSYHESSNPYNWIVNQSGGPIVEQATHFCDVARYLAGDVDESSVHTLCLRAEDRGGAGEISSPQYERDLSPENRAPRVTMSHWRFSGGGLGSLTHTVALKGRVYETSIDVQMNGLRLTLHEPYRPECTLRVRDETSETATIYSFGYGDPYDEELKAFLKAIETKDTSLIQSSYEDATKTYNLTWAIRKAEAEYI